MEAWAGSAKSREEALDQRAVGWVVGSVGKGEAAIRRHDEVAAHLAQILLLHVLAANTATSRARAGRPEIQLQVGRQGARGEHPPPGGPAEMVGAVGDALLVG